MSKPVSWETLPKYLCSKSVLEHFLACLLSQEVTICGKPKGCGVFQDILASDVSGMDWNTRTNYRIVTHENPFGLLWPQLETISCDSGVWRPILGPYHRQTTHIIAICGFDPFSVGQSYYQITPQIIGSSAGSEKVVLPESHLHYHILCAAQGVERNAPQMIQQLLDMLLESEKSGRMYGWPEEAVLQWDERDGMRAYEKSMIAKAYQDCVEQGYNEEESFRFIRNFAVGFVQGSVQYKVEVAEHIFKWIMSEWPREEWVSVGARILRLPARFCERVISGETLTEEDLYQWYREG